MPQHFKTWAIYNMILQAEIMKKFECSELCSTLQSLTHLDELVVIALGNWVFEDKILQTCWRQVDFNLKDCFALRHSPPATNVLCTNNAVQCNLTQQKYAIDCNIYSNIHCYCKLQITRNSLLTSRSDCLHRPKSWFPIITTEWH